MTPEQAVPGDTLALCARARLTAALGSYEHGQGNPSVPVVKWTWRDPSPWARTVAEGYRHKPATRDDQINNAVELMMKTYLGLPRRVTGLAITRKEYQDASESFPALLDALEKYSSDKLDGVDLGAIEWYHRLRNELYHQGNGLTVERDKVEIYAELANVLFKNLFGYALVEDPARKTELLGEFLAAWAEVERGLRTVIEREVEKGGVTVKRLPGLFEGLKLAHRNHLLNAHELAEIEKLRNIRTTWLRTVSPVGRIC